MNNYYNIINNFDLVLCALKLVPKCERNPAVTQPAEQASFFFLHLSGKAEKKQAHGECEVQVTPNACLRLLAKKKKNAKK